MLAPPSRQPQSHDNPTLMPAPLSPIPVFSPISSPSPATASSQPVTSAPPPRPSQVIGEILLSLPPDECDRVFPEVYLPVMAESNRRVLAPWRRYLFFLPEFWRYSSRLRFLDLYLKRIIAARWAAMEAAGPAPAAGEANGNGGVPGVSAGSAGAQDGDFLTQLIAEMRSRGMGWSKETEEQLCYEMKTLLLAGHETSAAMLTFATHEVFSAPNALRRVREEADACLPPPGQVPERGQVDRMECTHAVLKETLRKWSVVPVITRWVAEDDVIAGQAVPKVGGTQDD